MEATAVNLPASRCHVCGRAGGGPMVCCRRCLSAVHTDCYAMRQGADYDWLCDACADAVAELRCDLCHQDWTVDGAWQPVLTKISSSYIHMICAKVKYRRGRLPQNAQCTVCGRGGGKLLGCQDASKCRQLCHASCALTAGLMDGFVFRCRQHSSADVAQPQEPVAAVPPERPAPQNVPSRPPSPTPPPSIFDHDNVLDLKSSGLFGDAEAKVENVFADPVGSSSS